MSQAGSIISGSSSSGSWVLIQSQVAVAATTLNFTTGIVPPLNNFVLLYDGVTFGSASNTLTLQVSTNGGVSYIATGYSCTSLRFNDGGSGVNSYTTFVPLSEASSSLGGGEGLSNTLNLYNLTSGVGTSAATGIAAYNRGSGDNGGSIISGTAQTSVVVNALQIATDAGSTFSGNFNLYGIPGL